VSNVADGITFAALPLLTAVLTRDPFLVALSAMVHALPWFGFELIAGELVDRLDRRRLMLWGNVARAALIGAIAALTATDQLTLPLLYGLAFLIGVAETLVDTSWEAMVPRIVSADDLETAFGRTQATEWTANELIGPPLGGVLFVGAAAAPFFVDGGLFLVAALLIAWIPGVFRAEREVEHGRGAMRRDIAAGIVWLWRHKVLRALSLMAGTSNLVGTATFSVFVLFAQDILGLGDTGFGIVLAAAGIGGIIGAALAHRIEKRFGPATILLGSMSGIGLSALVVASTSSPVVVGVAFAADGFLIATWNVIVVSLRQLLTPDEMRGRVASVARTVAFGAIPLGAVLGGLLADAVGLRAPFFVAAATNAVAVPLMATVVSNSKIAALRSEAAA
jgi:MFS family permease